MIEHNHIADDCQSFIFDAVIQAIHNNANVNFFLKKALPFYGGTGRKVNCCTYYLNARNKKIDIIVIIFFINYLSLLIFLLMIQKEQIRESQAEFYQPF
jgi:hypothetical protein